MTPTTLAGAAAVAVVLAAVADRAVGEPPTRLHPVAWFGRLVAPVDREWRRPRLVGAVAAVALPGLAAGLAAAVVLLAGGVDVGPAPVVAGGVDVGATPVVAGGVDVGLAPVVAGGVDVGLAPVVAGGVDVGLAPVVAATVAAAGVVFSTTSLRMLVDEAAGVARATGSDLAAARRDLRALAGRDASALSPGEVRSAAVESAAENLADGLVAPLAGFLLPVVAVSVVAVGVDAGLAPVVAAGVDVGATPVVAAGVDVGATPVVALALGAAGAAWVKAVNTCDSMLGYRTKPVGWAAARLDDATMYLPARATAALLAIAAGDPGAVGRARRFARRPASPNSGWPMATLAAVLGVRLAKPGHYALAAGASLPTVADARRGVAVVDRAGWLAVGLAVGTLAAAGVAAWS